MSFGKKMKIADGVAMLDLTMDLMGPPSIVHPTLIWDDDTVILVDAGFPGLLPRLQAAMLDEGVSFERLDNVILTHQDFDHLGGLPGILIASQHPVAVLAHAEEKPYIDGTKRPIKMTPERIEQMQKQLETLPPERRDSVKAMFAKLTAQVDRTVADGEVLPYCGGITVLHTPGHTPGHICLYLNRSKTLISGDALNVADGQLVGPRPQYTYDMEAAMKSVQKLTRYDIQQVICYHGGLYREQVNQRIAELAGVQ